MSFNCSKCGACCRNLQMSDIYSDLDSGNGICKYLVNNLCSIYDSRPIKCRIDECYEMFFSNEMSKDEFYLKNYEMCKILREMEE